MLDSIKMVGLEAALVTMNVSLTPELEKFVNDKVKTGLYNSASEVVRESLRLLRRQDELEQLQLDELRREVRSSMEQMDAGEGAPIEAVRERILRRRGKGR